MYNKVCVRCLLCGWLIAKGTLLEHYEHEHPEDYESQKLVAEVAFIRAKRHESA